MTSYFRMNSIRRFYFLLLTLFLLLFTFSGVSWAQSYFIPLERGDATESEDHLTLSAGVELSGDFRLRYTIINSNTLPESRSDTNSPEEASLDQDVRLRFRSIVDRVISINLELSTNQEPYYQSDIRSSRSSSPDSSESQSILVSARQSYLELNRNPNEITKIGKHEINIGDRRGKVFTGILTGASQKCTAGTWCYELGGMKLSTAGGDWLYFFSLDYTFWENFDVKGEITDSFHAEMFRIKYTEHDIPLGRNNVPATRLSTSTLTSLESSSFGTDVNSCDSSLADYTLNSSCKPVYYNAFEQEYFGLRFNYETSNWSIYADLVSNIGSRNYFQYDDRHNYEQIKNTGAASEFEMSWKNPGYEYSLLWMYARGDKELADASKLGTNYNRNLEGYFEITPGTYQGTQFYFSGGNTSLNSGTGLGHSINNTQMSGFRLHYDIPETTSIYKFGLYELQRVKPVLDANGDYASMIGVEMNNTFVLEFAQHAKVEVDLNVFSPARAFSYDDHSLPTAKLDMIFHFAGRLTYSF